jgi:glycosyltransferase involved in cell wall biosynthesis
VADIDSRPTLLVVGPLPPPAFGVAKATQQMVESQILASRLRVVHLDTTDPRELATMGRFDWSNVYLGLKHLARLVRCLSKERPDVMLLTVSQGRLALLRDRLFTSVALVFGTKVAAYLRGSGYADLQRLQGRFAAYLLRSLLRRSSLVIVLGRNLVGMAQAVYPGSRVAVVPNGCPPAVGPDHVAVRDEGRPLVLYMGLLSRAKGLEETLLAVRSIVESVPAAEFVLCGQWDPPQYQAEMSSLVEDSGLSSVVHFPGPTAGPDKQALLARAWVLVVPSHSEGQPWVILEAMSAGTPVVATDTGAIAETIEDDVTGFVVPVGDSRALAERVAALLRDTSLWKRMSEESVRRYHELFTMERSHSLLADELCRIARGE